MEKSAPNRDKGENKETIESHDKLHLASTKEAYFANLSIWVKNANISQNAMALFPWYLLHIYPQFFQNHVGVNVPTGMEANTVRVPQMPNAAVIANGNATALPVAGFHTLRILDDQAQADVINRVGGYEYIIAPFWKRAVAELVDIFILLFVKVIVMFTVMNIFDLDLGIDLDNEAITKVLNDNDYSGFVEISMDFLALSSDLLMLDILTKGIVCFYEAICTILNVGATPGKALMGLRIQYCEAILPLQPPQQPLQFGFQGPRPPITALIFPAETPSFKRAFTRAVAKNLIMTLLFPVCFVMVFFKNNRTAYDIMTKTIVVEDNANPILRRPR